MKYRRDNLIEKLIAHEGLRLEVYQDTLGINTIGIRLTKTIDYEKRPIKNTLKKRQKSMLLCSE